jgi:hypothetical protein
MRHMPKLSIRYGWPRLARLTGSIAGLVLMLCAFDAAAASAINIPNWGTATQLGLPGGAATSGQAAGLNGVFCTSTGNCAGAGNYIAAGGEQAMAVTETSGSWGGATQIALPAGFNSNQGSLPGGAGLNSVWCDSPGSCVAVGYYKDTNDSQQAMVATETGGTWAAATTFTLPGNATISTGATVKASLYSVTCTSPGNCVAGGYYSDAPGDYQPMVAIESSGVWTPYQVALPANQIPTGQNANIYSVSCSSPGECVGAGYYTDANNSEQPIVVTQTGGGVFGSAAVVALPANQAADAGGAQNGAFRAVTCTSTGNCQAVGHYTDTGNNQQGMAATETNGTWGAAIQVTTAFPPGAATSHQNSGFNALTCTSQGNCVAGGYYADTNGSLDLQVMFATETNGAWDQPTQLALPSGASGAPGAQKAALRGLVCTSPGICVGTGNYSDSTGQMQAMVVNSAAVTPAPPLSVSTTSLPAATVGTAYSAQLAATGGAGANTWSLSTGSLPAGLTLNASTGAISGTPTTAGTSHFTATVSDQGPPPQTVPSAPLSIVVTGGSTGGGGGGGSSTTTTTATVGNQQLTLTTPSACVANTKTLPVTFKSTTKSKGAKLKFSSVAVYIDKGVKHTHKKTVHTSTGKTKKVTVTVYVANATAHSSPVTLALSLKGLKSGSHTLKVVATYKQTTTKHGHKKTVTVIKTLTVKFSVC